MSESWLDLRRSSYAEVADLAGARRWFAVAGTSLVLAGFFALLLVLARMPGLSWLFTDTLFFKRCLVVHVDLALVIWFYAFLAGMFQLIPAARSKLGVRSAVGAGVGVIGMMLGAGDTGAAPVLANYVPVIDSPMFLLGLVVFAVSVLAALFNARLFGRGRASDSAEGGDEALVTAEAAPALKAAALAFVTALVCFWGAWLGTPSGLLPESRYELMMWGGGHVLMFANAAAMAAVWLSLVGRVVGRPVLGVTWARRLFALYTIPLVIAPLLATRGSESVAHRVGFTRLMELGIFPVISVVLIACLVALARAKRRGLELSGAASKSVGTFAASAILTITGFVLGALISGSNTVIPAHYHAAIGGVTAAFMGFALAALEPLGLERTGRLAERLARWQVPIFGAGQLVFVLGFAFAGAHGAARKAYATEQQVKSLAESVGLVVMGAGGLLAAMGGLIFVGIVGSAIVSSFAARRARSQLVKGELYGR
ncbi:MAG: cbb3-type cytochrome c oxidase subunit I [Deltaproteobacteria bacterium]|nr:cbb3-type cytochrome c oxidase subunit I [Deltaproteobacteria bacterium]